MTKDSVIELVKSVAGVDAIHGMIKKESMLHVRYVASVIMYEEGYSHAEIAAQFSMSRSNMYNVFRSADNMLRYNRQFKDLYLACIAKIAENEA